MRLKGSTQSLNSCKRRCSGNGQSTPRSRPAGGPRPFSRMTGYCSCVLALLIPTFAVSSVLQAAPNSDVQKLAFLIGDWTSVETAHMPGREPITFELTGKNRWTLGGDYVKIEESFEISGRKFYNLQLMTFDSSAKAYKMWWFSSGSAKPTEFTGEFQQGKLVFTAANPPYRITYVMNGAEEVNATLEIMNGDKYQLRTEAKYKRKSRKQCFGPID